ncbi:c-type cytochrome biogenesis protein CcsB [Bordetella sp. FB-8]|uniref:c-type cytochrome biogenesis protein CcsB n=1 Tax=Bordetella sp. FB-8 TaxID=1159870 RepID=UPI0003627164|nr:c-type cytochrome biogenesis protein CcsB [Bordetella sp. FB-8]
MTTDFSTSSSLWPAVPLASGDGRPHRGRPDISDLVFFLLLALGAGWTLAHHGSAMDYYEKVILCAGVAVLTWLGWLWRPLRGLLVACGLAAGLALVLYGHDLARADHEFLLKYLLSSQSAILWMCALFILATVCYWLGFFSPTCAWLGTVCTWGAVFAGLTGMLVRWRESHLMGPGLGHIPVSNLYEVFVLFSLITALFYLYYERRYATRALGGFVLLVISAAIGFLLWYALTRDAWQIQPLIPALQSWWMKLHVPANFIGYGSFSLSAMVACAYLVKQHFPNGRLGRALPAPQVLDDLMYRSIAVGFAFFTLATVLGALWAADAWGTYWQWDPKETWALIVWLNYAAWLHMRLMKGLRGSMAAWWALVGLAVTTFAFLGVNMFLSGLHSYGGL